MKIVLYNSDKDKISAEFNFNLKVGLFSIVPTIYDDTFSYLIDDLNFFRTKWMTRYLSNRLINFNTIEKEMCDDFIDMMEDNIKYYNIIYGSYKLIKHD
jgi:hypothetical protein